MNPKTSRAIKQLQKLSDIGNDMRLSAEGWENNFQTLVSIIMSARTRDETTIKVAQRLFSRFPDAKSLSKARIQTIEKLIRPVNFCHNKARNILNCAKALVRDFNYKVPESIEELVKLPGVGRKTANVFITEIGGHGIGVDTHVSYCSQKLGWTKNSKQEKIESDLKKLFPKKYWNLVNSTLVRFGKTHQSKKQKDKILEEMREVK